MKRRQLLAIGGGSAVFGASGCLDQSRTAESEPAENGSTESDDGGLPEHPGELDREEVADFVEEYERAREDERDLTCTSKFFHQGDETLYMSCKCADYDSDGGSWGAVGHVMYAVTPDDVTRVETAVSEHPKTYEPPGEPTESHETPGGLWFGCFDEGGYDVSVRIRYQTEDGYASVLDDAWADSGAGAKFIRGLTTAGGTYELRVERADGTTRTETTKVHSVHDMVLAAIVITPDGDLQILEHLYRSDVSHYAGEGL